MGHLQTWPIHRTQVCPRTGHLDIQGRRAFVISHVGSRARAFGRENANNWLKITRLATADRLAVSVSRMGHLTGYSMKELLASLEKLQADAAECALIRDLATDREKRELYARLAENFRILASEVELVITARANGGLG